MNLTQLRNKLTRVEDSITRLEFFLEGGEKLVGEGINRRLVKMHNEDYERGVRSLADLKRQRLGLIGAIQSKKTA